ncbi:MAG: translation elongation factor Ts [Bacteroidetes bacterium GWC2_33_15]|nr:MAG: translation elongation factor Ts [Bacteroidetes bacterium GWA2_33_15]OFX49011.1 MAG: translation elongation factor Ts [Bacteroidetes bacterium GWC2_33_15]OFX64725.1 MAG: translation elongation factor Ts [Bacteroidetes bacterium GWB2_32_14]OFX68427.1 MAG: translation elongation factor Ts [Bacteroidetes bacterium GWD2_33_33]HAN19149.1 elongation factor Ts [Bacteroidales bacterium]
MAQITAADVSKLRHMTGAGMMDCKKALTEAEGDFDKAIQIIRERGQAVANKRSDREASEGVVLASTNANGTTGIIIALKCETDFVAKNVDFVKFAEKIIGIAIKNAPANLDALRALDFEGVSIADKIIEQTGIIGEKIELAYFEKIDAAYVSTYIHSDKKLATLVGFNKAGFDEQVGKDVAMQVAAMDPVAVDKDFVPQSVIEKELEIGRNQALAEGKAAELVDKIAQGKLGKFYKDSTLLNQDFIKESKISVKQYLQQVNKELTVTAFKRCSIKQ